MSITNSDHAFELLNEAHAFLNSCDDDGDFCEELIALEDAIAALRVRFEHAEEDRHFNITNGLVGRRYRSAEQAYKESREMVL